LSGVSLGKAGEKRTAISAAAVFAAATAGLADELSDIQAQSKQLREQKQALTNNISL